MDERKNKLLKVIVDEYVDSADPVGSTLLVEKYGLDVSPATVRNEMMELEKDEYIYQPHTSAGRIPTEKGYKYYVDNFLKKGGISQSVKNKFKAALEDKNFSEETKIKNIAKILAQDSNEAVIIAFEAMNIYYTGISNLFSQPEFYEHRLVCNLSEVIDGMDKVIYQCYNRIESKENILIGRENPFSNVCGSVMAKFNFADKNILMCILGPMRMDYGKNLGLVECVRELIK